MSDKQRCGGIRILFDGPPGQISGRFVEVESDDGQGIKVGEWIEEGRFWVLRITKRDFPEPEAKPSGEIGGALKGLERQYALTLGMIQELCRDLEDHDEHGCDEMLEQFNRHLSTVREWVGAQRTVSADLLVSQAEEIARLRDRLGEVEYLEQLAGDLQKICAEKDAEIARLREQSKAEISRLCHIVGNLQAERDRLRGEVEETHRNFQKLDAYAKVLIQQKDEEIDRLQGEEAFRRHYQSREHHAKEQRDALQSALEEARGILSTGTIDKAELLILKTAALEVIEKVLTMDNRKTPEPEGERPSMCCVCPVCRHVHPLKVAGSGIDARRTGKEGGTPVVFRIGGPNKPLTREEKEYDRHTKKKPEGGGE